MPAPADDAKLAFLGKVATTLMSSLDYAETLQALADLAVPALGDWCAVDMVDDQEQCKRLAVAHSESEKIALAHTLWMEYPPSPADPSGVFQVVRTGQAEMMSQIPDELLVQGAKDARHLELIRKLGLASYVIVPLRARGRILGAVSLVHAESGRAYQPEDLAAIEDFSGLAALAVDNAQLVTKMERALTGEKNARLQAQTAEEGLQQFIDNLPTLAWTARPDGFIDNYNRRWYEYTGTTYEDMQGWGWESVHDPEALADVRERWQRSLGNGEPFEMEFTLKGADGQHRWFLTRVVPMRDTQGTIVRWFGTNTNIDEIRAAGALAQAVVEQSSETEQVIIDLRDAKERAEARIVELEKLLETRSA